MRLLYSALWWLGMPLVLFRLWRRGRKEPGYRQHIAERLGFYRSHVNDDQPTIWVHAVSVGEVRASEPLVEALLKQYPLYRILLTHMTATGRATGAQLFGKHGGRVIQSFLPYDTGWMCARFLTHFKPALCILMETEVWPNLVEQCRRQHVPVMLANARLSARSLRRGQRFASLLQPAAQAVTIVGAQTDADAKRLRQFGARHVEVTGSLKFDVQPPADIVDRGLAWKRAIGERKILLCASTREGEEQLILEAMAARGRPDWLTIIVPRHPQRFEEVAAQVEAHGFSIQRRSAWDSGAAVEAVDVLLGDSMGEMFAYYAACDVAFIGGSLLPLGGQNLIEACALGKPVLIGQYTFNFDVAVADAIGSNAALRVQTAGELLDVAGNLLQNEALAADMGQAAFAYAAAHRGATDRSMALVENLLY